MLFIAAGFTRRYIENASIVACGNEPLQLAFGEVRSVLTEEQEQGSDPSSSPTLLELLELHHPSRRGPLCRL